MCGVPTTRKEMRRVEVKREVVRRDRGCRAGGIVLSCRFEGVQRKSFRPRAESLIEERWERARRSMSCGGYTEVRMCLLCERIDQGICAGSNWDRL